MFNVYNAQARKHATRTLFAITALMVILLSSIVQAKDKTKDFNEIIAETALNENEARYAPESCDFEMIFPGEPYTTQHCPDGQKSCSSLTGYRMVYDVTTSIDISVTCVPSTPAEYSVYNPAIIKTALAGMVRRNNIKEPEVNTREKDGYRIGSLLGSTIRGRQNAIYNAQLWVGQNSILTLEARLVGPSHAKADVAFGDILSSVKKK